MLRFAVLLFAVTGLFGRNVRITVLATTDLHGNVYPWDYLTGKPSERGLARVATLIQEERRSAPNALLVDAGDTIQGAPLESVWQNYVQSGKLPLQLTFRGPAPKQDPMILAMNRLRYDAMAVGNHEFNFGISNLDRARSDASFPWLSANTRGGSRPFDAYLVKSVDGVKVALIGITTPVVPYWEKPENYKGYSFTDPKGALRSAIAELKAAKKADLVVVVCHAGLDRDLKTGRIRPGELPGENMVYDLATDVSGIDAIIFGHTHSDLEEARVGNVLLTQPKNWGMSLARLEFDLESTGSGWRVKSKSSRLIPVTKDTPADPEILALTRPYHDLTERYLNSVVAESPATMSASASRIQDTPIIDAVQAVQLHYAKADVSFAACFNPRAEIPAGPVTVRQIAGLYIYDNELYAIEGTGKMVREALENAARYFNACPNIACEAAMLINRDFIGFNFDMAQGISYAIDLTQPVGQRIRHLQWKGSPLRGNQKLRIALNNYRAGGSGGYTMFKDAPVVWRSYENIRDLIIRYYAAHPLPAMADGNWRIVPETAREKLQHEVRAGSHVALNK